MKRQLLNQILFISLLLPTHIFAQTASPEERDITGLWKGSLYNDTTKKSLPYEIAISEEKGKLSGFSYTLFDIDGKKELGVKRIKIIRKNDQLIIEDLILIANNYTEPPPRKVRQQSVVNLLVNDTAMQLTGKWSTNRTREYLPLTGSLQLVREIEYKPQVLFKKLVELKLDQDLSFVKAEKKDDPVIAIKEKSSTEIKLPIPAPSQAGDVDQPNKISSAVVVAKIEPVPEDKPAVRVMKASVLPIANLKIAKKIIALPLPGKKKELMIAANYQKKETIQPVADIAKSTTPPAVVKKTEPVTVSKELAKKDNKPPAEIVKKPVVNEKPTTIPPAVVNNKTVPVAVAKEPVKKAVQTNAVIVAPPAQKKEVPAAVVVPISGAAANVSERKMNKEQFVSFESDSLVLTLYDNGDVDGDTVSVLMNGQIIFAKQGLSTTPQSKTIYVDKDMPDSLSMIMYAENLGSIPPNTGLLIIMDGEKRYEVRFSADLKTNAAILLRRKIKEQ